MSTYSDMSVGKRLVLPADAKVKHRTVYERADGTRFIVSPNGQRLDVAIVGTMPVYQVVEKP